MRRAYLRSDVFYFFWFRPSSRQHPRLWCFICLWVSLEHISKSEGISVYNISINTLILFWTSLVVQQLENKEEGKNR